jgi:hypothetical protein
VISVSRASRRALGVQLAGPARDIRRAVALDATSGGVYSALHTRWRGVYCGASLDEFCDVYTQLLVTGVLWWHLTGEECTGILGEVLDFSGSVAAQMVVGERLGTLHTLVTGVGTSVPGGGVDDTWLYFFEEFLLAYDPEAHYAFGVTYTPQEIVQAQVRLTAHELATTFCLPKGFSSPEVTGSGIYPLEILRYSTGGDVHIEAHDILVSSYAAARAHIDAALGQEVGCTHTVRVHLGDTLEQTYEGAFTTESVAVCVGNPPWRRDDSDAHDGTARRGGIVRHGVRGRVLFDDFLGTHGGRVANAGSSYLYDYYVYFWRWALYQVCENAGRGIVSLLTPSYYLGRPAFTEMRRTLREYFDELYIIDLGGEGRGEDAAANIFEGVSTPVCLSFGLRRGTGAGVADVYYQRLYGTREEKLEELSRSTALSLGAGFTRLEGALFLPEGDSFFPVDVSSRTTQ